MNWFKFIFILLLAHLYSGSLFSQGCSDAGFCTMSDFKPEEADSLTASVNKLLFGVTFGSADHNISVFGTYLEYNRKFGRKFGVDIKATTLSQSGNGVSTFGVGDLFLSGSYRINKIFGLTMGVKVPLTDGNRLLNNQPLPMDYQSSLGTFDLIIGSGFNLKKLQMVLAVQYPLTQNSNTFLSSDYSADNALSGFQSTNKYIRSSDILFRISYTFKLGKKLNLIPGLLPIYHLSNDKFTDFDQIQKEIVGSEGLTLNANLYLNYEINNNSNVQLIFGAPLIIRDARPDGLTRHYVFSLEYNFSF